MTFPKQDADSLSKFYGQPWKVDHEGLLQWDANFEKSHITRITVPFDMWMGNDKITKIAINHKCADSLSRILARIAKETSAAERQVFQIDQYGGGFNQRPIRGYEAGKLTKNKISLHAYGAAIDLAPALNPLGLFYDPARRMMPHEIIEIFKNEGWAWGGDFTRPDTMHFQMTT